MKKERKWQRNKHNTLIRLSLPERVRLVNTLLTEYTVLEAADILNVSDTMIRNHQSLDRVARAKESHKRKNIKRDEGRKQKNGRPASDIKELFGVFYAGH
jgi:hypothetical protein